MTDKPLDFPFWEVAKKAKKLVEEGFYLYQKFTCAKCGQRLTMSDPNVFHKEGSCDKCGHITNIELQGCNYLFSNKKLPI